MGNNFDMENAIDNCANEFKHGGEITNIQANYLKETKQKVSSTEFWNYVDSLNISKFREAVEKVLN